MKEYILITQIIFLSLFISCEMGSNSKAKKGSTESLLSNLTSTGGVGGSGVVQQSGGDFATQTNPESGVAQLRHIVDPENGTFKSKVTIAKNYSGTLYLSGLNITSLTDKLIKVRFKFGQAKEPITVPATITRSSGLVPQTDIELLALDFGTRPLNNIRLLYDLFDYNIYGTTDTPTSDPRNLEVYCRGLNLEDDPTFEGTSTNQLCDTSGESCLYAFAKIVDQGLVDDSSGNNIATIPSEPQVDLTGNGYDSDTAANMLKKCLPDSGDLFFKNTAGVLTLSSSTADTKANLGDAVLTVDSKNHKYRGPYRAISTSLWQMSTTAAIHAPAAGVKPVGLFASTIGGSGNVADGIVSYLFPRAGKLKLAANIEHLSSSTNPVITAARTKKTLLSNGDTEFMDGCNIRATNQDSVLGENIGACNVTATIELITEENGQEKILTTTKDVKLQLIRPSLLDVNKEEVFFSSFKSCSTTRTCASNECCFNQKCWPEESVSLCSEDADTLGSKLVGVTCTTDYDCISLCCNSSTSKCAVHNTDLNPEVLCQKAPGESCVAKEWCSKINVPTCLIVKTGVNEQQQTTCSLRCYNIPTHGDCVNGLCKSPSIPAIPTFDPSNPDCSSAVDPPSFPEVSS